MNCNLRILLIIMILGAIIGCNRKEPTSDINQIDTDDSSKLENIVIINSESVIGDLCAFWNTKPMINQNRFNVTNYRNSLEAIKPYTTHINLVRVLGGRNDHLNQFYKGVDSSGKIITDFGELITSMRNFMRTGFKPRIVLDNVPWAMSDKQEQNTYGNTNPPADYNLWRQYIKAFLQALIDEFGYDEVKTWRMRVGTEPNYFPHHWNGTKEQYFRHYDETVAAVTDLIPEIEIGPGNIILNQSDSNWGMDIIDHCAIGTNYVTGKTGTQMDFFCTSYYEFLKHNTVKLEGFMSELNSRLNKYPAFVNIPLDIQEFGILQDEHGNSGLSLYDGTEYGASWYAAIGDIAYRQDLSEIYDWGLDFQTGLPTPRAHVVTLLRKMENGKRLQPQGSLSGFSGVIPAKKEDRIYLLVYNHEPERSSTRRMTIRPKITGSIIENADEWTLNEWTLDREHGEFLHDLYEDCRKAGVPIKSGGRIYGNRADDYFQDGWMDVFETDKEKYAELSKLPQTVIEEAIEVDNNAIQLEMELTSHSVKLIELIPHYGNN